MEYEVYVTPGTKFKVVEPKWYAPGDIPKTKVSNLFSYNTKGYHVSPGDLMPVYWFATNKAKIAGKGVPTVGEMYLSKIYGDLILLKQYAPWNWRIRPVSLRSELSTTSFIGSEPTIFSSVKASTNGRPSALIFNSDGKILVTRILGQKRWDLPGGHPVNRWFRNEKLEKAGKRELYEEAGIKPDYFDHVDTFTSTFSKGGKPDTFHIFEGFSKDKPSVGSEIVEYAWWDGISKTIKGAKGNYSGKDIPLAEFALETMQRRGLRNQATAQAISIDLLSKKLKNVKNETELKDALNKLDKELDDAVLKGLKEGYERGTIPYRPSIMQLPKLREEISATKKDRIRTKDEVSVTQAREEPSATREDAIREKPSEDRTSIREEPTRELSRELFENRIEPRTEYEPYEPTPPRPYEPIPPKPREPIPPEPYEPIPPRPPRGGRIDLPKEPPPPPIITTMLDNASPAKRKKLLKGMVTWKQGFGWWTIYPPYGAKDRFFTRKPIKGIKQVSGAGSAYKTITKLGQYVPRTIKHDLGIMDIEITKGKGIKFKRDIKRKTHLGYAEGESTVTVTR